MELVFPKLPKSKLYEGDLTPEQFAQQKSLSGAELNENEEEILKECLEFYHSAYKYLKEIDLSKITDEEAEKIKEYLLEIFRFKMIIQNKVSFDSLYRVTLVRKEFLENDRVKSLKFITHPPLEIIKKNGVYGRANTTESTRFYSSFDPLTAIIETKPNIGDRIIITHWRNKTGRKFTVYPLSDFNFLVNEGIQKAAAAFEQRMKSVHPMLSETFRLQLQFLSEEFTKKSSDTHPKKYEYLFSAFFSDFILNDEFTFSEGNPEDMRQYDGIIYPSVACNHELENFVLKPECVKDLIPYQLQEYLVENTFYQEWNIEDARKDRLPFAGKLLRHSMSEKDGQILWSDEILT